jgi:hypothetical protein
MSILNCIKRNSFNLDALYVDGIDVAQSQS